MATLLMDEIVEEILFRIPPDDPMTLVRAALVCKQWRHVSSDPGFRRRFRDIHAALPMLGVLCNRKDATDKSRFIPTSSFRSPHQITSGFQVVDARHGRVLLRTRTWACSFAIWDPINDKITCKLPDLPFVLQDPKHGIAAVLCTAEISTTGDGGCDHRHCQHGPFHVVYIEIPVSEAMFAYVYSSDDGIWRRRFLSRQNFSEPLSYMDTTNLVPSELIGNVLHFVYGNYGAKILKYDLITHDMSVIPTPRSSYGYASRGVLMTTEEGELGFASIEGCRSVHLWSRQLTTIGKDVTWALTRVIELHPAVLPAQLVGFATGVRVLFLTTTKGIHAMDLKSGKTTTISKSSGFYSVFPYMNFYPF